MDSDSADSPTRPPADPAADPVAIPALSLILGFGPMLPLIAAGLSALSQPDPLRAVAIVAGTGWASALLLFIAGVRRGYGFATRARPRASTLIATITIFVAGLIAIPLFLIAPVTGVLVLILGFLCVAILDRHAALTGAAPRHFARLRPPQMAVGLIGLLMIEAACIGGRY